MIKNNAVLLFLALACAGTARATEHQNNVSLGYALTHMSGSAVSGNAAGLNSRYLRSLSGTPWGIVASLAWTKAGFSNIGGNVSYTSLLAGPSYRFHEYVRAYALLGAAGGRVSLSDGSECAWSPAYGVGVQFLPADNWSVDVSWEYSQFDVKNQWAGRTASLKSDTWILGVGYRF